MTMGLTIQDEETRVVPDTARFWNQVAFLVGHFDPDRNGLVEVLCRDVASRSRPAQITFLLPKPDRGAPDRAGHRAGPPASRP